MKPYLKTYCITAVISVLCMALPWLLEFLGVFTATDINYYLLGGLAALAFTIIYAIRKIKLTRLKVFIILLNPAIYYIIALIFFRTMFTSGPWNL